MQPKRLVLLVEGDGDVEAAPILIKRLLREYSAFDAVFLDEKPFRVGDYSKIGKNDFGEWRRFLKAAIKRKNFGGCVLLLDGDSKSIMGGQSFCAMQAARQLAIEAKKVGAGSIFSTAIVFACMEFESWLIAGFSSLVNKPFKDGRKEIISANVSIPQNLEIAPRDAKGWFRSRMKTGYKPTRDQSELTELVDINTIRNQKMRSFQRLESAVKELVEAIRSGIHVVTPTQ
jgi:hypothetical protein